MPESECERYVEILKEEGIEFDAGLTDAEVRQIEATFGFQFPPDLRAFLRTALPVSKGFPDWRHESEESLRERLDIPLDGVLFDVEYNHFWLPEWSEKPPELGAALDLVRQMVEDAPTLIPVYKHRMMPDRPNQAGNPVFSVHQTDIICYGIDLRDYLAHEFLAKKDVGVWPIPDDIRRIEFWDIERFSEVRWAAGPVVFDNRKGTLP